MNRGESDGGPCYKQHIQTYRLGSLREPVNFSMSAPRSGAKRTARAPPTGGGSSSSATRPLAYHIDALTQQKIKQGIQAVPFI